jgi:hypothetical protein
LKRIYHTSLITRISVMGDFAAATKSANLGIVTNSKPVRILKLIDLCWTAMTLFSFANKSTRRKYR